MNIAVFGTKSYDKEYISKAVESTEHSVEFFESRLRKKTARLAEGFECVCVFVNDRVDSETIDILAEKGVKLIALRCAGFNNVDVEAATKHNITVVRVPSYSPYAVSEHALALVMTLNRKTHKAYNRIREGNFSIERLTGFDIHGKTVGIIGTGKIGALFGKTMKSLGCKILGYDKFPNQHLVDFDILEYVELDELLSKCDIISLHCPLTPETYHVVNDETLSKMKDGVMLINTSRGRLIDTEAAIRALMSGKLGYLGIDVYEQEENLFFRDLSETLIRDEKMLRLMQFPNVLVTGHQAFFTENALTQIANTTLQNVDNFEKGITSGNVVTTDMVR